MAVSAGAAGGTSDLEFISQYLNSDSDLMASVKCDCLLNVKPKNDMIKEILEELGEVKRIVNCDDLFQWCFEFTNIC